MIIIAFVLGGLIVFGSILWYSLVRSEEKWEQDNRQRRTEEHVALLYDHLNLRVRQVPAHKVVEEIKRAKKSN